MSSKVIKTLKRPRNAESYSIWHYCKICGKTYTHSQSDFEEIKKSSCCINNLEDIPIDKEEVEAYLRVIK